jgi:N-acetylneuraminic acid mutarotase
MKKSYISKRLVLLILLVSPLILLTLVSKSTAVFATPIKSTHVIPKIIQEFTGVWFTAGTLVDSRHDHTATLLPDGRVLVVGGLQERTAGNPGLASVEVYDPVSGTWSITGFLNSGRTHHTAGLLPDGTVLVTGGKGDYSGSALASVEIYDPISGTWKSAPPLSVPRYGHSATRLADERVLVAGGRFGSGTTDIHSSAEIYNPVSKTWTATGSLNTPRESHSATLLSDGRVLLIGGYNQSWLGTAEIFDPLSGVWSEITAPLACHGVAHTATLMCDGKVFVVGGACESGTPGILNKTEIYDPTTSAWKATADLPAVREAHTATLLNNGMVLVVGGDNGNIPRYDSGLIYDPASDGWYSTGSLVVGRRNHTATLLDNGVVLVMGGWSDTTTHIDSAEKYLENPVFLPIITREIKISR